MKSRITIGSLLLGLMSFLYLYFLLSLVLFLFYKINILEMRPTAMHIVYFFTAYSVFSLYSFFKIKRKIKNITKFIKIDKITKIIELAEFLLFSVMISFLFYLILRINLTELHLLSSTVIVIFFLVLGTVSFKKIFNFLLHIIVLNVLYSYLNYNYTDENKIYKIYEYEDFLERAEELINQAKRFNLNLGFIVVYFPTLDEDRGFQFQKFLRKQINFLLINNSRNYESWGRSKHKNFYIKILEVNEKNDVVEACERFFSLLKQHNFYVFNKKVEMNLKMLGVFLKKKYFESNELNLMDEFLLVLKQDFELVRRMEEDLKIIELE